jgi:ketol-acid reductoisomerase
VVQKSVATGGSVTQIGDVIHGATYDVCLVPDAATGRICAESKEPLLTEITNFK